MTKFILSISAFLFLGFCCVQYSCSNSNANSVKHVSLLPRNDTSRHQQFLELEKLCESYLKAVKKDSNDNLSKLKLIEIYINEARITGNQGYYNKAAFILVEEMLSNTRTNQDQRYQALAFKANILLSLHRFSEAKVVAEEALKLNGYDADIYGALVDAHVELGNYPEAIQFCDKMISIRPDIRSYSRVSYIRQIHGDNSGAKAAMRMAVEAGKPGEENTEWARVQLGDLYLNTGNLDTAAMLYESTLYLQPNFAYALMGMSKICKEKNNVDSAIYYCKKAFKSIPESSFLLFLSNLYRENKDTEKANKIAGDVLALSLEAEEENAREPIAKHNGTRELAMAYLQAGNTAEALRFAGLDIKHRPNNIDANEFMAKIHSTRNEFDFAETFIQKAMCTNCKHSSSLALAATIYANLGNTSKANEYRKKAMEVNASIDVNKGIARNF